MATEMITVKMDDVFLNDIDNIVKQAGYQNRTEFIRNALREKVEEYNLKKAMIELSKMRGKSKKKTTDSELELIRERAFVELEKKFK
jgi:metal-responsive CopG/Arc/MetJ family transcriptional regulator